MPLGQSPTAQQETAAVIKHFEKVNSTGVRLLTKAYFSLTMGSSAQQWPERIRVLLAAIPNFNRKKRRLQMNKFRFTIKIVAIAIFMFAFASLAQAQATRTWVSGVGDDVNPCSRTAPCKTFAGAISKTADNGEIDCLDPGGFGAVTITKSIVLDGGGTLGSILGGGTPSCVIINDQGLNTKTVTLRRLSINGSGGV